MTIYKYPIRVVSSVIIVELPLNAEILTAQVQNGTVCLWAKVEEKNTDTQDRVIEVFLTGVTMDESDRHYIGTVQMVGGAVWHLFERL